MHLYNYGIAIEVDYSNNLGQIINFPYINEQFLLEYFVPLIVELLPPVFSAMSVKETFGN